MEAKQILKEVFNEFEFINYNASTKKFLTAWYPFHSVKTGRTLTITEVNDNTPDFCEVEIKNDKFRITRKN
jgi:hypothetical protein